MGKLIQFTAYTNNSTQYSPSITIIINEDEVITARIATTAQKQTFPSASQNINTWLVTNEYSDNAQLRNGYLIGEQLGTLITESN